MKLKALLWVLLALPLAWAWVLLRHAFGLSAIPEVGRTLRLAVEWTCIGVEAAYALLLAWYWSYRVICWVRGHDDSVRGCCMRCGWIDPEYRPAPLEPEFVFYSPGSTRPGRPGPLDVRRIGGDE